MTRKADLEAKTWRLSFMDPVRRASCALVIPPKGHVYPSAGEPKIGIQHPGCDVLADLSVEYDAFYCQACGWNGRVSGAWCVDMIDGIQTANGES